MEINNNCLDVISNRTIEVSGFDGSLSEDILKLYFESEKSVGRRDAVQTCSIVSKRVAHLTFHDSQGMECRDHL